MWMFVCVCGWKECWTSLAKGRDIIKLLSYFRSLYKNKISFRSTLFSCAVQCAAMSSQIMSCAKIAPQCRMHYFVLPAIHVPSLFLFTLVHAIGGDNVLRKFIIMQLRYFVRSAIQKTWRVDYMPCVRLCACLCHPLSSDALTIILPEDIPRHTADDTSTVFMMMLMSTTALVIMMPEPKPKELWGRWSVNAHMWPD